MFRLGVINVVMIEILYGYYKTINIYKAFELVFDNTFTIMSKLFTILDYYSLHETPHSKVIITPHVCYSRFFITLKKFWQFFTYKLFSEVAKSI